MDYVTSLKRRLGENDSAIAALKEKLALFEIEQHRLSIALEVVTSMASEPEAPAVVARPISGKSQLLNKASDVPIVARRVSASRLSGKELIVKVLAEAGFPMSRMDVVSYLAAAGHTLNPTSVGPTLSRLVDLGFIEKASHSHYRIKLIAPKTAG
jgi:hypothetical protein